jgi:hypothetical protein
VETNPTHPTGQSVETPPAALKTCTKCKRELAITEFHRDKGCRNGLHPSCKACVQAYGKARSPAKKAALAAIKRQYRRDHIEKARLQSLVNWHKSRAAHSKTHFTVKQWLNLLKACNGQCVCCGIAECDAPGNTLTVDHVRPISKGEATRSAISSRFVGFATRASASSGSITGRLLQQLCEGSLYHWPREEFILSAKSRY